jgi:hypothetical protein
MADIKLESLVLRGSAAVCVGEAGNLRRGTSYAANGKTPEIRISLRHPSLGTGQAFQPAMRPNHADDLRVDALAASGAGRSLRQAGVLSSRGPVCLATADTTTLATAGIPAVRTVVMRRRADLVWCKPATRTPPASTWGLGVR